jgi:hypothetical protein
MAKTVSLVHPQQTFQVLEKLLVQKCGLFMEDPIVVASPYTVKSKVSQSDFRTFVSALEGAPVAITNDNFGGLSGLCEEFHFGALAERLSQFRESDDLKEDLMLKDLEARKRLSALEEQMQRCGQNCRGTRRCTNLLRKCFLGAWGVSRRRYRLCKLCPLSLIRFSDTTISSAIDCAVRISGTGSAHITAGGSFVWIGSSSCRSERMGSCTHFPDLRCCPPPLGWSSAIVADFPKLFEDFKKKQFTLLRRGSSDGFGAYEFFHSRCDWHPNTLTVILDTDGNIFGRFSPVMWDSPEADK